MTLKEPIQSRCWRSYVADASAYRNLPPVERASCRCQQVSAADEVQVAHGKRVQVGARMRRYQSAMLKMGGEPGAGAVCPPTMMEPLHEARPTR